MNIRLTRSIPLNGSVRLLSALAVSLALVGLVACDSRHDGGKGTTSADSGALSHGGPQEVALVRAIEAGSLDKVKALIAQGADVNAADMIGRTPFHAAAFFNRDDVAALLVANSAKVNAPDIYGLTPLHAAVLSGSKSVAALLISKGADVNAVNTAGLTPLHLAAAVGQHPLASLLLQHGADINAKDEDGHGALYFATVNKHQDTVDLLKKAGAKPEAPAKS